MQLTAYHGWTDDLFLCATLVRDALEARAQLLELLLARLAVHAPVDVGHALAVHLDLATSNRIVKQHVRSGIKVSGMTINMYVTN